VAMMAGDRVTGLVLMGSGPSADTPVMRELWTAVQGLADPVDAAFVREFQVSTVSQPPPDAFMEAAIANSLRMPAWTWRALLRGLIDDEPLSRPPSCKALVVGGRQDAIFSVSEQTALARQLPKGELELVNGVGHALHWEQPERFVHALARVGVSGALTPL
jgi:non-heme chloroperoxidase